MSQNQIMFRKCVGCNERKHKSQLLRIVRLPDTREIQIDLSGKLDGRGSYICKDKKCIQVAIKSRRIERVLKCKLDEKIYEELKLYE